MQISMKCDKCENYYRSFCLKLPTPAGFTGTVVCYESRVFWCVTKA